MDLVYCLSNGFTARDLLDDIFGFLCPDKGFGVLVVKPDVFFDGSDQFRHTLEYSPTNPFPCDLPEPSLYQIQPRRTGWREVKGKAGMFFKPGLHLWMAVRSIVIQNQVNIQFLWYFPVDPTEDFQELRVSVTGIT